MSSGSAGAIGIFDSGIGGLTVAHELGRALPQAATQLAAKTTARARGAFRWRGFPGWLRSPEAR